MGKWVLLLCVTLAPMGGARAEDCALGKRYLELAADRTAAAANDEALAFLRQSIDACPTYDAYERLGETAAQSTQKEDKQEAVKAFVEAHARAPDAPARARSLFQYASLLDREGDPQNAYPLIKEARALDPANRDIGTLAGKIEQEQQHPTQEHIVRALRYSLFQPLTVTMSAPTGSGPQKGATAASAEARPASGAGPSVNIQINFKTASIAVDEQTQPNIELLAHALADPSLAGRKFLFVGHSDMRGTDDFNLALSKQRAEAIFHIVSTIEPSLQDRVSVEGRGSREPIDPGSDDNALRANRRLQVLVR